MSSFFCKLRWLVDRRRKEAELDEELQFHVDEEAEERLAQGADSEQARWDARRDLGNITLVKERTRATWTWLFVENVAQVAEDGRYAFRGLKNNPRIRAYGNSFALARPWG